MCAKIKIPEIILLVEDEDDHAELIANSLREGGNLLNNIRRIDDGQEAVNYLKHNGEYNEKSAPRPGLILLDIKIPRKNGFQVLQEIKSDENLKTIPVVVLTTTSTSDDIEKALALGANDFIVKPIVFKDFVEKVKGLGNYWVFVSDSQGILE